MRTASALEPGKTASAGLFSSWPYLLLIAVGVVLLIPGLGSYGHWDEWEPGYVQSAREMAADGGSLLVPEYLGQPDLARPVLGVWGIFVGSGIFGHGELGARIVGVLFAIAAMLAVFHVIGQLRGRRAGLLSALVLASMTQFAQISRQATTDVYLFTTLATSLLFFAAGLLGDPRHRRRHLILSYFLFGLAILAKGPIVAGVVGLGSVALFALAQLDLERLTRGTLRGATWRFAGVAVPSVLALPLLTFLALFFGAAPRWWGHEPGARQDVIILRERIAGTIQRFHLADIALLLLAAAGAATLIALLRRGTPRGFREWAVAGALATVSVVALVAEFSAQPETAIRIASWLGLAATIALLYVSTWRWLRHPELWPTVRPHVGPVVREILTFGGIVAAVAGPWHLYVLVTHGDAYVSQFLVNNHVTRIFEEVGESGSATHYMRTILFGLFPWSPMLPVSIALVMNWRGRDSARSNALELLMLATCAVTFATFTFAVTKHSHYIAPMVIPAAVLVGLTLDRLLAEPVQGLRRIAWIATAMLYLLPMVDLIRDEGLKYLVESFADDRSIPSSFETGSELEAMLALPFLMMLTSALLRSRIVVGMLVTSALLFSCWGTWYLVPTIVHGKTFKHLSEAWKQVAEADDKLGIYDDPIPGAVLYTDARIQLLESQRDFHEFMHPRRSSHALVDSGDVRRLQLAYSRRFPGGKLHELPYEHDDYALIGNRVPRKPAPAPGDDSR